MAQKVVYDAFELIQKKLDRNPLEVFTEALNNIMPALEVKARRVGGATYQVPIEVRPSVVRPSVSAGWSATPASAAKRP